MDKYKEALLISEEILTDLELERISMEKVCFKCLRLFRLLGDNIGIKWMTLEINGYDTKNVIQGIDSNEFFIIGNERGRGVIVEELDKEIKKVLVPKIWTSAIGVLESSIMDNRTALNNIKAPESYTPAISSSQIEGAYSNVPLKFEHVQEKYQDVLKKVKDEQNNFIRNISTNQGILGRVKSNIYTYVLERYHELKYGNLTYTIFTNSRDFVITKVGELFPNISNILASIDDNIQSNNPVNWSNAVTDCRRILQELADKLCPSKVQKKIVNNKEIDLGPTAYINRIIDYIESKSSSEKFIKIVGSHLRFIGDRIDSVYESSNKGTHLIIADKDEAERYIIYTFLLLSDILSLID